MDLLIIHLSLSEIQLGLEYYIAGYQDDFIAVMAAIECYAV